MTVSEVILNIGYSGMQQIKFLFELDGHGDNSLLFLGDYPDSACHTVGSAPTAFVECVYTRDIVVNDREHFSFRHKTSRPGTAGLDPVYDRSGVITFVAPSGTEFADSLASTSPDDMICQADGSVKTHRTCWFAVIHPGKSKARGAPERVARIARSRCVAVGFGVGQRVAQLAEFGGSH